ncbi:DUF2953 domain-containing protein [Paenibacillus algorifonticola]|uniref:DUF2953 domain-containing protein n=1 Tax=Paenibacillus algorifonticola TaxID=684063 RepID=UPI003D27B13D
MPGNLYGLMTAAGLFFLFLLLLALASPVRVFGKLSRKGEFDHIDVRIVGLYGLLHYKVKIPHLKLQGATIRLHEQISTNHAGVQHSKEHQGKIDAENVQRFIEKLKHALEVTDNLKGWVKQLLKKVQLTEWKWSTTVGVGDAMWTAMTTGAVWSIKTTMLGVISQFVLLKADPVLQVQPMYQGTYFQTEWHCTAKLSMFHAVRSWLSLRLRLKKGSHGIHVWHHILFK